MPAQTCSICSKQTVSVIEAKGGFICFQCYAAGKTIGKGQKRQISHQEADIQAEFFDKVRIFIPKLPDKLLFAVPNGGSRHIREAQNLKLQGVKRGVSDVILLIPRNGYGSLCIEFKTEDGQQSDNQKEFQRQAEAAGNKYVVARSVMDAIQAVRDYLKN